MNVAGMVNGFTPLFAACENNDLDVAKILVEAGADTNAKSRDGGLPCCLFKIPPRPLALAPLSGFPSLGPLFLLSPRLYCLGHAMGRVHKA